MNKRWRVIILLLLMVLVSSCAAPGPSSPRVHPRRPYPGAIWVPGHRAPSGVWIPGYWR